MFKSKIDFNAFDKNNEKVVNVELNKLRGVSKVAVKKLLASEGERTPFYLIKDYFKDSNNKPLGHFLSFGVNKPMAKHFKDVELKSGKDDRRMSANPKEAAMGEAFVKLVNGKSVLHLEPTAKAKIPKGKWEAILKRLKPFLGGISATVVFEGANEVEENDLASTETNATLELKPLIVEITSLIKGKLKEDVIPNLKAKKVTEEDLSVANGLIEKINTLNRLFSQSEDDLKAIYKKHIDTLGSQLVTIQKVSRSIAGLLSNTEASSPSDFVDPEEAIFKAFMEKVAKGQATFDKKIAGIEKQINDSASAVLESGAALLQKLF
jgi:hypothetical protein